VIPQRICRTSILSVMKRKWNRLSIGILPADLIPIDRGTVKTRRRSGFEATKFKPGGLKRPGQSQRRTLRSFDRQESGGRLYG
jgi:hypothetical protein